MTTRPNLLRRGLPAAISAIALVTTTAWSFDDPSVQSATADAGAPHQHGADESSAAVELRHDMRKLWEDHVTWTRQFIVSAIAGLPDVDAAAGRLLQNQADIGDAVAAYYGDDAGAQLTELLRGHILVAADLIAAAKSGDVAALQQQEGAWDANAVQIAEFLAAANPAWPADTLTAGIVEQFPDRFED
jgi:hypothetical protein